jgi:hypothetical protein
MKQRDQAGQKLKDENASLRATVAEHERLKDMVVQQQNETLEKQQQAYVEVLLEQSHQVERDLTDEIASLGSTVAAHERNEQKFKSSFRATVAEHERTELELQLKLVLNYQTLQEQVAQFEQKDPEQLRAQSIALQERVAQYIQEEQSLNEEP